MKKYKFLAVMFAMLLLVLAACGNKEEATEDTSSANEGTTDETATTDESSVFPLTIPQPEGYAEVTLDAQPKTVVAFDYGFLDTLDALGVDVAAVSQQSLPKYLSKYADESYKNAGALKEPDFEAIHAMKPDVIFISGRQADAYEELSKIAPTVYVGLDTHDYLNSFKANTELAGKIFGKEAEATKALEEIDAQIAEITAKTSSLDEKALVVLASEGELSAYGPGSRFGVIHDVYGIKPADENLEVSTHGQSVSFEYVLEKNPDMLFVVDRDAVASEGESGTKAAIENEIVSKTNAVKNGKVFYLDPEAWYLSGGGIESEKAKLDAVLEAIK